MTAVMISEEQRHLAGEKGARSLVREVAKRKSAKKLTPLTKKNLALLQEEFFPQSLPGKHKSKMMTGARALHAGKAGTAAHRRAEIARRLTGDHMSVSTE
jgi:hypothetical protein